jgi:uncharacterized membrane protein YdjX (TVP38/TMEM64 family)
MTGRRRAGALLLSPRTRAAFLVVLLGAMLAVVAWAGFPSPARVRAALAAESGWTPVVAVLGIAVLAVLLFPRTGIALLAGLLFGPLWATVYIVSGTLLGAAVAFALGRLLGREYLDQLAAGTRGLARLESWLERRAFLAVVAARLLPVVPFGLLNYGFGATRVSFGTFLAGTAVGILPSTVLYSVVGASAADPTSPVFLGATALTALLAVAGVVIVGRLHRHGRTHGSGSRDGSA